MKNAVVAFLNLAKPFAGRVSFWPTERVVAGCGALALCLAASLGVPSLVQADDGPRLTSSTKSPAPKASSTKLNWHVRGAAPQRNTEVKETKEVAQDSAIKELPAEAVAPTAPIPPSRQAARTRSSSQLSTKSSRAKLRDAIMQVSNQAEEPASDPLKDPFDQNPRDADRPGDKAETPGELELPQVSPSDETAPPATTNDPFPEDRIPLPPSDETSQYPEETMIMPAQMGGCENDEKDCSRAINKLRADTIDKIVVGIVIEGEGGLPPVAGRDYPCECRSGVDASFKPRAWSQTVFNYKATGICHKPLYFEDVHLERYGHSWNPVAQPFLSAAHFFISVPLLPYKMGLNPPQECIYTLGYYRPGNCAPYLIDPIPFSLRAALFEGAAITGFGFLFFPPAG